MPDWSRAKLHVVTGKGGTGKSTVAASLALALASEGQDVLLCEVEGRQGIARLFDRFGVIEFATTLAPGVRDVLLTGKVFEAAKERRRGRGTRQYDAVVLDAPPTGRIAQFLGVNSELAGLARMGPIKTQADMVMTLFRSSRTAIHLVTVLEEMPVQETADGIEQLRAAGLPVGGVIVNLVRPRDLGPDELAAA